MLRSIILVSTVACGLTARAQVSYDAASIPDSLRKNAHVVVRDYELNFTELSPTKATLHRRSVVTVLDEQGKWALSYRQSTNSFSKLESADLLVFDAHGMPIQHVRQKDMRTESWGEGLVDDAVDTRFDVGAQSYPISILTDETIAFKSSVYTPAFNLANIERSIQHATMTVTLPKGTELKYFDQKTNLRPVTTDDKDNRTYTWTATGIKAVPEEKGCPSDAYPVVFTTPTHFQWAGVDGDMSTWKSYGQFQYDLSKDTYTLPEASQQFYRDMVKGVTSDVDKARILYRYLQQNFRYVEITLGNGGWKSLPATFTEKKKYGDCKGLSTYLSACLAAVGVKSYTALVNSGERETPVDPAFPLDRFDHVILCIPQPGDSIWLECTSKRNIFGVLGAFTENRNALLITENGGVLVRTPKSTLTESADHSFTQVDLADDGSGKADVLFDATGEERDLMIAAFYEQNRDDEKRWLVNWFEFTQPDEFSVDLQRIDSPEVRTHLNMTFEKVPEFTAGSKMFLKTHLYTFDVDRLPTAEHRTQDYYFPAPYTQSDTTCYKLPDGYVVDELPKGATLNCPYATYTSTYWYDAGKKEVFSYAVFSLKERHIPASGYGDLKRFYSDVIKDGTEKIVINKP